MGSRKGIQNSDFINMPTLTIKGNATADPSYPQDLTVSDVTTMLGLSSPNTFGTIAVSGQSDVVADSTADTLTLVAGSNITITTNASTDTITIAASGGGGGLSDGDYGDIVVSGGATALTIDTNVVTNAKAAQMAANTIKGNNTGALANAADLTVAQTKTLLAITNADVSGLGTLATQNGTFSGTSSGTNTGDQTITLTGDVTGSGTGSFAATIAANAVTLAKMATMATSSFFGRITAGVGIPEILTGTQATTLLDTFTSVLKGLAPASGGGTSNFLRADGSWAAPIAGPPTFTQVEKSLVASRNGNFSITGLSGLTIGKPVQIWQDVGPYTNKGTLADEAEMDGIDAIGSVTAADTIVVYWNSPTTVKGNFKFRYLVGA